MRHARPQERGLTRRACVPTSCSSNAAWRASRSQAQRLIATGACAGATRGRLARRRRKNGDEMPTEAPSSNCSTTPRRATSRAAGSKLEGALARRGIDVAGRRCLDVGQSHRRLHRLPAAARRDARGRRRRRPRPAARAAARRSARDRASKASTRAQPRRERERRSTRLRPDRRRPVVHLARRWCCRRWCRCSAPDGDLLMLVKPQFELQPGQVGKGGIVRDAGAVRAWSSSGCAKACAALGLRGARLVRQPDRGRRRQPRVLHPCRARERAEP